MTYHPDVPQRAGPRQTAAIIIVLLALAGFFVALTQGTAATSPPDVSGLPSHKVFVCKYVGKPFVDERLQTGQNPISVDISALEGPPVIGQFFEDRQGRSVVIAFDTGQPEPSPDECPVPPPPTTHVEQTTTFPDTTQFGITTTTTIPGTTTTTLPGTTTTSTTSTTGPPTTPETTVPGQPTVPTTLPESFTFAGAATVCRAEVPTIVIDFATPGFPSLAGNTGSLTMTSVARPSVTSTQPLVYQPGGHVELLYPGTSVNPDGSIADVPGWILQSNGLWVIDPSDAFLREGILLTFTVNPTAEALVTYPPESSACANPENFPPGQAPPFEIPPAR